MASVILGKNGTRKNCTVKMARVIMVQMEK